MNNKLLQSRVAILTLFYLLAANLAFIDKVIDINQFQLGIDQDYWGSNSAFFGSVIFWFNLFIFSICPYLMLRTVEANSLLRRLSLSLPIYWGFILFRGATDFSADSVVYVPNLKYFVYGVLIIGTIIFSIKMILVIRSLKVEHQLNELEKFKESAMRKLEKLNPDHNQKLLQDVLGNHGEALNFLVAANLETDDYQKQRLLRLALNEVSKEEDSILKLKKRLTMFTNVEKYK